MRVKVRLDTLKDINRFVAVCSKHDCDVHLTDGNGLKVSAKSIIGAMYSMEFSSIYCESDKDISGDLLEFIL